MVEEISDDVSAQLTRVIAPVIVSSAVIAGDKVDESGPIIEEAAHNMGFAVRPPVIIPDGEGVLAALSELVVQIAPAVIITSGGTGLSAEDLTPEFTTPLLDKEIPGVMEAIRAGARGIDPATAGSRGVAGVAEGTIVVNLPGDPRAVARGMEVLREFLPQLCDQVAETRDR